MLVKCALVHARRQHRKLACLRLEEQLIQVIVGDKIEPNCQSLLSHRVECVVSEVCGMGLVWMMLQYTVVCNVMWSGLVVIVWKLVLRL